MAKESAQPAVGTPLKALFEKKGINPSEVEQYLARIKSLEQEVSELKETEKQQARKIEDLQKNASENTTMPDFSVQELMASAVKALKEEDPIKAIGLIQAILLLEPDHIKAKINLGVVYAQLGEESRAIDIFRQVIDQDPDNTTANKNLDILLGQ